MTLCLSAIKLHFWHVQSLHWQCLLCPLSQEIIPWFRHLAHLGLLADESLSSKSSRLAEFAGEFAVFIFPKMGTKWLSSLVTGQLLHKNGTDATGWKQLEPIVVLRRGGVKHLISIHTQYQVYVCYMLPWGAYRKMLLKVDINMGKLYKQRKAFVRRIAYFGQWFQSKINARYVYSCDQID